MLQSVMLSRPDPVQPGAYPTAAAGCAACHGDPKRKDQPLAGGARAEAIESTASRSIGSGRAATSVYLLSLPPTPGSACRRRRDRDSMRPCFDVMYNGKKWS